MSAKSVTIVDYDVGNLLSVQRAFEHCGARATITGDQSAIRNAERLVLPGVGAFGDCVRALKKRELTETVLSFAESGRPFLGICVGMQMLFNSSEEFGMHEGLGLVPGKVVAIPKTDAAGKPHKTPNIGWIPLMPPANFTAEYWRGTILDGLEPGACAYFVHSYTAQPANAHQRLADADYNGRLVSAAIRHKNISGTQFHPEKSGPAGLAMVRNFLAL